MTNIDQRDALKANPFSYRMTKDKLMIFFHGKHIKTLKGMKAEDMAEDLESAEDFDQQLILAKATGNFKRGNEKHFKSQR